MPRTDITSVGRNIPIPRGQECYIHVERGRDEQRIIHYSRTRAPAGSFCGYNPHEDFGSRTDVLYNNQPGFISCPACVKEMLDG